MIYKNIIISGCSYSRHNEYSEFLNKNYSIQNISVEGQSNNIIIKKIYDYINKFDTTNSLFICQLTYLHRIAFFHSLTKNWISYQPKSLNSLPKKNERTKKVDFEFDFDNVSLQESVMEESTSYYKQLQKMYETYLKYVFDEDYEFLNLLYQIDLLESYVNTTKNKILFIYWPEIKNGRELREIKKRNFFQIDGNYSMLNWTISNNMNDHDSHLSKDGAEKFAQILSSDKIFEVQKKLIF